MTILNTSASALLAFQRALDTISHNVANASTPGYSRQQANLAAQPGNTPYSFGYVGNGVEISQITRNIDNFQFARRLDSSAEMGRLDELSALASRLDKSLTDTGTGLSKPWSDFFDSTQAVASQPASPVARQALLGKAEGLAARFRSLDSQLTSLGREINGKLNSSLADANRLAGAIAGLNKEIARQQGQAGQPPNDLLDKRELLATELSQLMGATTLLQDNGAMSVFTPGGQALVIGTDALPLTIAADPYQPDRLEPALQVAGNAARLGQNAWGGQIAGLLEFRSQVLDPASAQLGRIATGFVQSFNSQHRQGMDLYGDLGGDFFSPLQPSVSIHAANTGSATLTATLADPSAFDGNDVALAFDGSNWTATLRSNSTPVAISGSGTVASPLRVGGVDVVVAGAAAAGDRFLLQPASGAASRVRVAITDPARVAAASPLAAAAAFANLGNARVSAVDTSNISDPALLTPATIVFTSPTSYTLDGSGPFPYNASTGIAGAGWTLQLDGSPVAGDRFDVGPRSPGSSDNGNARRFAALDDPGLLDGGTVSLNGAIGQLTVQTGIAARQAESTLEAQTAVNQQIINDREATSGVNLDEEAANMLRYQQAYQAAAQLVSTADTLFQTLLAAVRR